MQLYNLILQNKKGRSYDRLAILFFILSAAGMAMAMYNFHPGKSIHKFNLWIILPITSHLAPLNFLFRKKYIFTLWHLTIATSMIFVLWLWIGYWWVALIVAVFVLLYWMAQQEFHVTVSETGIRYDFFPIRSFLWNDLNNLMLKDGLLTIDRKNNRMTQSLIDENKIPVSEKEFNDFCRQQLRSASIPS